MRRLPGMRKAVRRGSAGWGLALAGIVCLLFVTITTVPAQAQDQDRNGDQDPERETLSGEVVDGSGAVVPGVRVWAVRGTYDKVKSVAEGVTDAHGRFALKPAKESGKPGEPLGLLDARQTGCDLIAQAPDGRLGWLDRYTFQSQPVRNVELRLVDRAEVRGRLVDQSGQPIQNVRIEPLMVSWPDPQGVNYLFANLPPALGDSLAVQTGADGSFTLKGMPEDARISVAVRAEDIAFGSSRITWTPRGPELLTVTLDRRPGKITGRFKPPDQRPFEGEGTLIWGSVLNRIRFSEGKYLIEDSRTVSADRDGRFTIEGLQPGQYYLRPQLSGNTPFAVAPGSESSVTVEPGATAVAPDVKLSPAVTVTGRVVDVETGKGVANAVITGFVSASSPSGNKMSITTPVRTDGDGRFRLRTAKGSVRLAASQVPVDYLAETFVPRAAIEANADQESPDIALRRAVTVEGIVVGPAGEPAGGAELFLLNVVNRPPVPLGPVRTNPDGTFKVRQVDPGSRLGIRARHEPTGAVTNGVVTVKISEQEGPFRITIDPKFAFRLHGRVADRAGKPIEGAKVRLKCRMRMPSPDRRSGNWPNRTWHTFTTDSTGRFESGTLVPGDWYSLSVSARGFAPFDTDELVGAMGLSRGLGTIKLAGTSGFVAGRVLDSAGKPLPDVTVFNRGNCLEKVTARTDEQGRFRLEGFLPGHRYVFAVKDGYRFTGTLVDGDRSDLTVRLLRRDEPPPAWKPTPAAGVTPEADRALARRILIRLWDVSSKWGGPARPDIRRQLLLCMVGADPALALEWSKQEGEESDAAMIKLLAATVVAEYDARAAVDVIRKVNIPHAAVDILAMLAARFAERDRVRATIFGEEAVANVKALPKDARPRSQAALGALLIDLGRADEGKKLVEEAVAALPAPSGAKFDAPDQIPPALMPVIAALARYDLKRAQKLAEPIQDPASREQALKSMAQAVARTDPARAMSLLGEGGHSLERGRFLVSIVYRAGADHPAGALKVIEGMKSEFETVYKADALGWLAVAAAKRDPKRAAGLIDRALSIVMSPAPSRLYWRTLGGPETDGARIALLARRIGYPDMDSVIAQVLATRPDPNQSTLQRESSFDGSLVSFLALLDPGTAREVLVQEEAGMGSLPAPLNRGPDAGQASSFSLTTARRDSAGHLIGWVLSDREKGEEKLDAALAEVEQAKESSEDLFFTLCRLAELLTATPDHREESLWGGDANTWYPGRRMEWDE